MTFIFMHKCHTYHLITNKWMNHFCQRQQHNQTKHLVKDYRPSS